MQNWPNKTNASPRPRSWYYWQEDSAYGAALLGFYLKFGRRSLLLSGELEAGSSTPEARLRPSIGSTLEAWGRIVDPPFEACQGSHPDLHLDPAKLEWNLKAGWLVARTLCLTPRQMYDNGLAVMVPRVLSLFSPRSKPSKARSYRYICVTPGPEVRWTCRVSIVYKYDHQPPRDKIVWN